MKPLDVNWKTGRVIYEDFPYDKTCLPKQQIDLLKEDLLQVQFGNNILVDMGWFPEFSLKGNFIIKVIKDGEWDPPLMRAEAKTFEAMLSSLQECIDFAFTKSGSR